MQDTQIKSVEWPPEGGFDTKSNEIERFEARFGGLTAQQVEAIGAILSTKNLTEAARACGASLSSLNRWISQDSDFREALAFSQDESFRNLNLRLVYASDKALDTLLSLMEDEATPPSVRQRAASSLIEHRLKSQQLNSIEIRLEMLADVSDYS